MANGKYISVGGRVYSNNGMIVNHMVKYSDRARAKLWHRLCAPRQPVSILSGRQLWLLKCIVITY